MTISQSGRSNTAFILVALAAVAFLGVLIALFLPLPMDPAQAKRMQTLAAIERGSQIWAQGVCMACHNPAMPGSRPLTGLAARYDERDLLDLFATPPANMPAVVLPLPQQRDLAAWLLATYP